MVSVMQMDTGCQNVYEVYVKVVLFELFLPKEVSRFLGVSIVWCRFQRIL